MAVFEEAWIQFQARYSGAHSQCVQYLSQTWITHKQKFVDVWIDSYLNLGEKATSRCEGTHATLKKYIKVYTGILLAVYEHLSFASVTQRDHINAAISAQRVVIQHEVAVNPISTNIRCQIAHRALSLADKQRLKIHDDRSICTRSFHTSMGIPCSHMIAEAILTRGYVVLTDFHPHWHLATITEGQHTDGSTDTDSDRVSRPEVIEELHSVLTTLPPQQQALLQEQIRQLFASQQGLVPLNDPSISVTRGRPRVVDTRVAASSTRRDPSGFEMVGGDRRRRAYTCGLCGRPGHNRNGCQQRQQDTDEEGDEASDDD